MIIKTYRQDKIVSLFRHLGTKSKLNQKLCSLESKLSPIYEFKHQNNYLFLKHLMIGYLFSKSVQLFWQSCIYYHYIAPQFES